MYTLPRSARRRRASGLLSPARGRGGTPNPRSRHLEIRGARSNTILTFEGWVSPGRREVPAFLDKGFFVLWILATRIGRTRRGGHCV